MPEVSDRNFTRSMGLPWWPKDEESALQCWGLGLNPWSGDSDPTRSRATKPSCHNYPSLGTSTRDSRITIKSLLTAIKTQQSQIIKRKKKQNTCYPPYPQHAPQSEARLWGCWETPGTPLPA